MPARILLVRWLPVDVARTWGCHWLEHVLSPKSHLPIPKFPPSGYLSSPLASVLTLARYNHSSPIDCSNCKKNQECLISGFLLERLARNQALF